MAFQSNLETDYDPDYLDSELKMQYFLSGKSEKKYYTFVKLMNQRFFVISLLSQKLKFSFGFLL